MSEEDATAKGGSVSVHGPVGQLVMGNVVLHPPCPMLLWCLMAAQVRGDAGARRRSRRGWRVCRGCWGVRPRGWRGRA